MRLAPVYQFFIEPAPPSVLEGVRPANAAEDRAGDALLAFDIASFPAEER